MWLIGDEPRVGYVWYRLKGDIIVVCVVIGTTVVQLTDRVFVPKQDSVLKRELLREEYTL